MAIKIVPKPAISRAENNIFITTGTMAFMSEEEITRKEKGNKVTLTFKQNTFQFSFQFLFFSHQ
jgi:hypothetical protein